MCFFLISGDVVVQRGERPLPVCHRANQSGYSMEVKRLQAEMGRPCCAHRRKSSTVIKQKSLGTINSLKKTHLLKSGTFCSSVFRTRQISWNFSPLKFEEAFLKRRRRKNIFCFICVLLNFSTQVVVVRLFRVVVVVVVTSSPKRRVQLCQGF